MAGWRCLTVFGSLILFVGIFIASINNMALDLLLRDVMVLSKTSRTYPMWIDLPVPLIASFYLFNVSNADDVYNHGAKPKLTQMGPFTFQEFHHKFNDVWNDNNGTVTYKQKKKWIHTGKTAVCLHFMSVVSAVCLQLQLFFKAKKPSCLFTFYECCQLFVYNYRDPGFRY